MAAQHPRADGIALYVHVPFCLSKCPYCDFNTYQGIESQFGDYLSAVTAELSAWARVLDRPNVNTVFLGGGTPSYLPDGDVARILDAIAGGYAVRADAEITAECNPNDLTPERCADLRAAGVNRVSIGVQSMDNGLLAMLGRRHDADEAAEALQRCRSAGFDNVNLDLMYGLPRQSLKQWRDTVARTVGLGPEHLSLYALTLEEERPSAAGWSRAGCPKPDPDAAADMYDLARSALADAGYRHYEISNWSRPGQESEHNLAYWRNLRWLGVGAGRPFCSGRLPFLTVRRPREYARRAAEWAANALASSPWGAGDVGKDPVGGDRR